MKANLSTAEVSNGFVASLFDVDPWILSQRWENVLFANWRYPAAAIRPLLPPGLELDLFDGSAWVSAVPLHVAGTHLHGVAPITHLDRFNELNLRTYVRHGDHHGVWFFSIDVANDVCSFVGRWVFHVPYHNADVSLTATGDEFAFASDRASGIASFQARYRPTAELAGPDDFATFLTERYSMFVCTHDGHLRRGDMEHEPWPLWAVDAEVLDTSVLTAAQLDPPASDALYLYSPGTQAHAYPMVGA